MRVMCSCDAPTERGGGAPRRGPGVLASLGALLVVLLGGPASVVAQDALPEQCKRLVVMIEARFGEQTLRGAGLVIGTLADDGRFVVATTRHLLSQGTLVADGLSVRFRDAPDDRRDAEPLGIDDPQRDLALLAVAQPKVNAATLPWNRLGRSAGLSLGDDLYTIGAYGREDWQHNASPDGFKAFDGEDFTFDTLLVGPGASGGGVFDRRWHLVGMAVGATGELSRARALSIDGLLGFVKASGAELGVALGDDAAPDVPAVPPSGPPATTERSRLAIGRVIGGEIPERSIEPVEFEVDAPGHGWLVVEVENKSASNQREAALGDVLVLDSFGQGLVGIASNKLRPGSAKAPSEPLAVHGSQRYVVRVQPVNGTPRVPFTVSSTFAPAAFEDPFEPNDFPSSAASIGLGEGIRTLVGFGDDPEDWYVLEAPRTGLLVVGLQNLSPPRTQFGGLGDARVLAASDMLTRDVIPARTVQPGYEARSTGPIPVEAGRSYLIGVTPAGPGHGAPYQLATGLQPYPVEDLGEPNDTPGTALELPWVGRWDALIGVGSDVRDCYAFEALDSRTVTVEVTNRNPKDTRAGDLGRVLITDADGRTMGEIPARTLRAGLDSRATTISVERGRRYFVVVEPAATGHIAHYTLALVVQ